MTDAINTTPTTPRTRWGRARVGPYKLFLTPEAIAVSVPRVVGNGLRVKLYRASMADIEGGYPSGVLDRFLSESTRCAVETIHHDEAGQAWINIFIHIGNLDSAPLDIHGQSFHECLTVNVMNASDCSLDMIETSKLLNGVPLSFLAIA